MKNIKLIKTLFASLFIFMSFLFIDTVQANSIKSIDMDIYIDSSGTAHIKEVWDCKTTQGTEVYHPYYNLGNSKITNLTVKDGNSTYSTLNSWNTSGSLSSKANKCGLNKISNGIEICWGISRYGSNKYEVDYEITNFISELTDAQMAYWTLIPYDFSNNIGTVYIKMHSDFKYSENLDVWGYGKYGAPCYVYNGYIEMTSNGTLYSDEYMTILVKFPLGSFKTNNKINEIFDYYLEMSKEGSETYVDNSSYDDFSFPKSAYFSLSFLIIPMIIFFIFITLVISVALKSSKNLDFGVTGNRVPKDVPYYRDIPLKGNIFRAYFISHYYNLMKNKTDLLGAILLKWLKEGKVHIEKRPFGLFKKETSCIVLNPSSTFTFMLESELHSMLVTASKDNILEPNEFKKWCSKHYEKILGWFDDILKYEKSLLINENKITVEEHGKSIFKYKKYIVDSSLMDEAIQLNGMKKFLKDLTLINKREPIEVTLFEEYLIFAQIFGIAKKVAKDFEDLYPNVIESYDYTYSDIFFIHTFASAAISSATTAKSVAESRASDYSGGGRRFLIWRRPVEAHLVVGGGGRRISLNKEKGQGRCDFS